MYLISRFVLSIGLACGASTSMAQQGLDVTPAQIAAAAALKPLAPTTDLFEQYKRFGSLARVADGRWLTSFQGTTVWAAADWLEPGVSMRLIEGRCQASRCEPKKVQLVRAALENDKLVFFAADGTVASQPSVDLSSGALRTLFSSVMYWNEQEDRPVLGAWMLTRSSDEALAQATAGDTGGVPRLSAKAQAAQVTASSLASALLTPAQRSAAAAIKPAAPTADQSQQFSRFGALARMAGFRWLGVADGLTIYATADWVEPGVSLRLVQGSCGEGRCKPKKVQLVRLSPDEGKLLFFDPDGSVANSASRDAVGSGVRGSQGFVAYWDASNERIFMSRWLKRIDDKALALATGGDTNDIPTLEQMRLALDQTKPAETQVGSTYAPSGSQSVAATQTPPPSPAPIQAVMTRGESTAASVRNEATSGQEAAASFQRLDQIQLGSTSLGKIEAGQDQRFALRVTTDQQVTIAASARTFPPTVRLFDAKHPGRPLVTWSDASEARFGYHLAANTQYVVAVSSHDELGSGGYSLQVTVARSSPVTTSLAHTKTTSPKEARKGAIPQPSPPAKGTAQDPTDPRPVVAQLAALATQGMGCWDSSYAGQPALHCAKFEEGRGFEAGLYVWGRPALQGRLFIYLREGEVRMKGEQPADYVDVQFGTASSKRVPPGELLKSGSSGFTVSLSDLDIRLLAQSDEVTITFVNKEGVRQQLHTKKLGPAAQATLPQIPVLYRTIFEVQRGAHTAYSPLDGEGSAELWGLWHQATSRSRFWISQRGFKEDVVDLQWTTGQKGIQLQLLKCGETGCRPRFTGHMHVRPAISQSGVKNRIILFDNGGRPLLYGDTEKGRHYLNSFDEVLASDAAAASGGRVERLLEKSTSECCLKFNLLEYRPIGSMELESLIMQRVAEAEAARQQERVRQAEERQRQAEHDAEMEERQADSERRAASRRPTSQVFAEAFGQAMRENNAQFQRQQQFLDNLGRQRRSQEAERQSARDRDVSSSRSRDEPVRSVAASSSQPATASLPRGPLLPPPIASLPAQTVTATPGVADIQDASGARRRQPTPEAILVCTRPDGKGNFECDTPVDVNLRGGPSNGLSAWQTPESLVAALSSSCPGARRLASSSHLVWGCGFGATNNANSMDRSAGVDVKGRKTYYCTERQTSCRETQP